jgi:hypothetical protein
MRWASLLTVLSTIYVQKCAEVLALPLLVAEKAPNPPYARFLRMERILIKIKGVGRHGMSCSQSYQQNMGISGHNFCRGKAGVPARRCAIFEL